MTILVKLLIERIKQQLFIVSFAVREYQKEVQYVICVEQESMNERIRAFIKESVFDSKPVNGDSVSLLDDSIPISRRIK